MRKQLARLLKPKLYVSHIFEVSLEHLTQLGMKGIMVDLDNTLTPWNSEVLAPETIAWLKAAKGYGFKVCMVSNNKGERIDRIASFLEIPFVARANKPLRRAFIRGLEVLDTKPYETVVIGDQVFTDILGGNRLGMYTILVIPISRIEFVGTRLMRIPERALLSLIRRPD